MVEVTVVLGLVMGLSLEIPSLCANVRITLRFKTKMQNMSAPLRALYESDRYQIQRGSVTNVDTISIVHVTPITTKSFAFMMSLEQKTGKNFVMKLIQSEICN